MRGVSVGVSLRESVSGVKLHNQMGVTGSSWKYLGVTGCMSSDDQHRPKQTSCFLSKYECSRVIGLRILQLQEGDGVRDPLQTAISEILQAKNPAIIRRYLPDGTYEDVAISTLKHDRYLLRYQLHVEPSG